MVIAARLGHPLFERVNIVGIASAGAGTFVVIYPTYTVSDALCCPSLPPTTVTYQWDGQAFRGTVPPPMRPVAFTPSRSRQITACGIHATIASDPWQR
jgi:LppP/LprE lipoprotein